MTTLCYRDGILAADDAVTIDSVRRGTTRKIAKHKKSGAVAGYVGTMDSGQPWLFAFEAHGANKKKLPSLSSESRGLIITKDGDIWVQESNGMFTLEADFVAYGSGADFALGAMAYGATAAEAVEIASRFDRGRTSNNVMCVEKGVGKTTKG